MGVIEGKSGHSIILDELNYWLPLPKCNVSSDPYPQLGLIKTLIC